jgi:hypothetical protein
MARPMHISCSGAAELCQGSCSAYAVLQLCSRRPAAGFNYKQLPPQFRPATQEPQQQQQQQEEQQGPAAAFQPTQQALPPLVEQRQQQQQQEEEDEQQEPSLPPSGWHLPAGEALEALLGPAAASQPEPEVQPSPAALPESMEVDATAPACPGDQPPPCSFDAEKTQAGAAAGAAMGTAGQGSALEEAAQGPQEGAPPAATEEHISNAAAAEGAANGSAGAAPGRDPARAARRASLGPFPTKGTRIVYAEKGPGSRRADRRRGTVLGRGPVGGWQPGQTQLLVKFEVADEPVCVMLEKVSGERVVEKECHAGEGEREGRG